MSKIRIKNIGPIVDTGDIALSAVMLIVGKQSSGKSTFMKILCFCRWIEKRIMLDGENLLKKYTHYGRFLKELKKFHRFMMLSLLLILISFMMVIALPSRWMA